jgi:hypothetical protein
MSVDSSDSPMKAKWQGKAEKCLQTIEAMREESLALPEAEKNKWKADMLQRVIRKCVSLHELEKIINEAEMYDIYDMNEVYDRLVDFHIKTLESIKTVKKCFPLKAQGSIDRAKGLVWDILCQGIKFREVEELIGQIDLSLRCEEAAKNQPNFQTLSSLLAEADKNPGAVDQETLDDLKTKKNVMDFANQRLKKLKKIDYLRDIDEAELRKVIIDIKPYNIDPKKLLELESLVKVSECLKKIYSHLITDEMIHQGLDMIVKQLSEKCRSLGELLKNNKEGFYSEFDEYSETCCRELSQILAEYSKQCEFIDEYLLQSFIKTLMDFLWKSHSTRLLIRNEEKEKILEDCIKEAPDTQSNEYAAINERLHCIKTAKMTESLIKEKLKGFWNLTIDKLVEEEDKVHGFVEEAKAFFNDKIVERQIEHLEEILNLFQKDEIKLEELNKIRKELDSYNTGYTLLDEVKNLNSVADIAKMYRDKVEYTWKRNQKAVQSLRDRHTLRDVQLIPRIEIKKAQEYLRTFQKMNNKVNHEFVDSIRKVEKSLDNLQVFGKHCSEFESQYSRATLLSLECTKSMIQTAFERFDKLVEEYMHLEIKDSTLEGLLEQNELFLKAQALLKNIPYPELRRDISSWETILQRIKKYSHLARDISEKMEVKMKMAEKMLMEAHKMRQFESQIPQSREESQKKQSKMLKIENLKELVTGYIAAESEIELQDTMSYLERVITAYEDFTQAIIKSNTLKGLEEILSNFEKLPLKIDKTIFLEIEERMKTPKILRDQFLATLNEDPNSIVSKIADWKAQFEASKIKIEEWDEFLLAFKEEQSFEAGLNRMVWENCTMEEVDEMKHKYQHHKFVKNSNIEAKLLSAEIGAIQGVYERRLFGEEKPGKLFNLETLNMLLSRCQEKIHGGGMMDSDLNKRHSFIRKFIEDIDRFTEDRIRATTTLEELNLNVERNPFGDMVDLTEVIEVQKGKLSKEALKYGPGSVKVRQGLIDNLKQLLENNPILQSTGTDFLTVSKAIEKAVYDRCLNRAKSYEDYGRTLLKIIQRLPGFIAISSYLKEKSFDLNLLEKLFTKSKAEFQTLEDNIVIKNKDKDEANNLQNNETAYNYYKIFTGTLFFGLKDNKTQKRVENAELFTCSTLMTIKSFSTVPNKLLLSMNITAEDFQKYLQKSILNENYVVMACWVRFPQDSSTQARLYMEKHGVVASSQYCKSCKIFILPKVYIKPEWLKAIDFYTAREDNEPIDFVCFKVFKKGVATEFEPPIVPVPMPFKENCTFYQVYSLQNNILERIVDPVLLMQNPKKLHHQKGNDDNTISCEEQDLVIHNDYDEFFYSEDEMDEENQNLLMAEDLEDNVWESQSNEWGKTRPQKSRQPQLLNMLQEVPGIDPRGQGNQNFQLNNTFRPNQSGYPNPGFEYDNDNDIGLGLEGMLPHVADKPMNQLNKRPPKTNLQKISHQNTIPQQGQPMNNFVGQNYPTNQRHYPTQQKGVSQGQRYLPQQQTSQNIPKQGNYYDAKHYPTQDLAQPAAQGNKFQRPQFQHPADNQKPQQFSGRNPQQGYTNQVYVNQQRMHEEPIHGNQGGFRGDSNNLRFLNRHQTTTYNLNYNVHVAGGFPHKDQYDPVEKSYHAPPIQAPGYTMQRSANPPAQFKQGQGYAEFNDRPPYQPPANRPANMKGHGRY